LPYLLAALKSNPPSSVLAAQAIDVLKAWDGGYFVDATRDYFNGVDPNLVRSQAFDSALTALGPDPAAWSAA
jgi:hypothetical protein